MAAELRGFGRSDKPAGVEAYTLRTLADDVVACVDRLSRGQPAAAVVHHDWGGSIAWAVGALYPETMRLWDGKTAAVQEARS